MKPNEAPRLEEWMNAAEAAEYLELSRTTVSKMVHAGEFKSLHLYGPEGASRPGFMLKRSEVAALKKDRNLPEVSDEDS